MHFAKKTKHARQNINYIGRYLKRPPMAASCTAPLHWRHRCSSLL
ncbi:TPA: hypothetical protein ACIYDU_005191 [Escherichia coli]